MQNNLYTEPFKSDSYLLTKYISTMRYSTTFSLIPESIADHSAQINLLILLHSSKYKKLFTHLNLKNLLIHATLHDLPEVISGDVVSPVKKLTSEIEESFKKIENTCIEALAESRSKSFKSMLIANNEFTLTTLEHIYFKLVDSLVVKMKADAELSLNNFHYKRVNKEILELISTQFNSLIDFIDLTMNDIAAKSVLSDIKKMIKEL